jgi:hypothetical protein
MADWKTLSSEGIYKTPWVSVLRAVHSDTFIIAATYMAKNMHHITTEASYNGSSNN